ncbi:lytic murein transglycosylase [Sphingomonas jeddahensis]|uniref:Membrane-bound lytic murein transglycosylase B n=1 Tax=Sphingomonas jeddahensis TaxID=1915074 RepID=A0A1V2EZI0_9SPHN|nr:lytic murein transglycosylase [Sphingomonas jeddahensis]ONF97579.1 Membrane-bound lytic murein transglycosylase B precursor [Sphingomonas jeddahensis]
MRGTQTIVRFLRSAALAAVALAVPGSALAQDEAGFQAYLAQLRAQALREGVRSSTVDAVLPTLTYNARVVELDRGQPGGTPQSNAFPPFAPYKARHVDAARISRGRTAYVNNRSRLARVEAETGVPESIMVAIWGHETNYGSYTGDFDLLRSLASLAYEGRRRALFAGEFVATLKIMDRGISRDTLKGSWAGATGNPQFLPSIYLRLAKDGDGDGRADIWNSQADTLASIGNYFVSAGWRPGQPWGFAVSVPSGFDRSGQRNRLVSPRCPRVFERHSAWRTMAEWRALGVVPQGRAWPADNVLATLMEPDGPGATAYLLTGNYRVILDYNCSNFYALSVGLLADAVER